MSVKLHAVPIWRASVMAPRRRAVEAANQCRLLVVLKNTHGWKNVNLSFGLLLAKVVERVRALAIREAESHLWKVLPLVKLIRSTPLTWFIERNLNLVQIARARWESQRISLSWPAWMITCSVVWPRPALWTGRISQSVDSLNQLVVEVIDSIQGHKTKPWTATFEQMFWLHPDYCLWDLTTYRFFHVWWWQSHQCFECFAL